MNRKLKRTLHRRLKVEPALHRVVSKQDPIAGKRARVEAADVLTRRLSTTTAMASLPRR